MLVRLLSRIFPNNFGYLYETCPVMPRTPNFPTTCDETQRLELAYLRRIGLLEPGIHHKTLHWNIRGRPIGSIDLVAHILPESSYLRLYYTVNDKTKYDYQVQLEAAPSNLPATSGHRYYMVCPKTGRRATVLYLRSGTGIFAHRLAFPAERLYYDSQLESKRFRGLASYFAVDKAWEAEYRKSRKTHYRGKPTRWYAKLLRIEQRADTVAPALLRMLNG